MTRLIWDTKKQSLLHSHYALVGTKRNCAGGRSPWGYLTCEETTTPGHGYVFLVDAASDTIQPPRQLPVYGRMEHEAAVVDPKTHIAYLTEDKRDSCFYRFVPKNKAQPFAGQLQALKIQGETSSRSLKTGLSVGERLQVDWVDIDDATPKIDNTRIQARSKGAAIFCRGEGLALMGDSAYFTCTEGAADSRGQIFRLNVKNNVLDLLAQSEGKNQLNMPDNLNITPWGGVCFAEDGKDRCHVNMLTPDGRIVPIVRNIHSHSEFAGVCFTPDYKTLFVNMQHDGITLAIHGPFAKV